jgi:Zn-dependent protease
MIEDLISTWITRAIALLVAMTVHEFAHAYVAYLNGDSTAKEMGRMTLDPRANINPMGFLIGVMVGFGVLGSAPVVPSRMRDPRWGMFQAVLAGPISNLLVAAVFAVPVRLGLIPISVLSAQAGFLPSVGQVFFTMVQLNVVLFLFNLIPLFPLDGWTVVLAALPAREAVWWQRNQQTSMYIFYGLIALTFLGGSLGALALINPLNWLVWVPSDLITRGLLGL